MPIRQQIFALIVCLIVFLFTIEMVRLRRLREEYSVLWIATSIVMFVLVIKYDWLERLTATIGAGLPTTTLFIGSIVFLMLISVQFSIKISKLTDQMKNLAQDNALLRAELQKESARCRPVTDEAPGRGDSAVLGGAEPGGAGENRFASS